MEVVEKDNEKGLVHVWDWPTRLLHWSKVLFVFAMIVLVVGFQGREFFGFDKSFTSHLKELHALIGYLLVTVLLIRFYWGFAGNRYARWSDMNPLSAVKRKLLLLEMKWYLSGLKGDAPGTAGHSPLASLFYLMVFAVLMSQGFTGFFLAGVELDMFPGYMLKELGYEANALGEVAEELHAAGFFIVLFFICAHITGVIAHQVKPGQELLSSMINGKKRLK